MADDASPTRPDVTFDFQLPHVIDGDEGAHQTSHSLPMQDVAIGRPWSAEGLLEDYLEVAEEQGNEQGLRCRQFSPGFSDDEGSGGAFKCSRPSHQIGQQAADIATAKKSPRRSDMESRGSSSRRRAKKARKSLFDNDADEMDLGEQVGHVLEPATLGYGIGNRMSSLNLDQQEDGEDDMRSGVTTGFGLACSDIGSLRSTPAPSDDEGVTLPDTAPCYQLRQNIDRKKAVTHVDTDKSGNWDPNQELRERAAKLNRAKAAKKSNKERRKRKGKHAPPKHFEMKCIVQLPFKSFGNVRNVTNDEQNWPDDWSEIDSEQERELKQYREHYRANTPKRSLQLAVEDPAGQVDDLTGHPAARGCKQCRVIGQNCSLIDGGKYPCDECVEDGTECHPIQEPTMKDRCKQCDQANIETCSFENDPTQAICDTCADHDHICEALPPHGYKAPRLAVDEIVWGPDRLFISCTTCRGIKGKRCSLKNKQDKPPCKWCLKMDKPCRFVDPPKPETKEQTAEGETLMEKIAPGVAEPGSQLFTEEDLANMHRSNNEALEREATPEMEMEDGEGNRGMLTKITTSFAHPIKFNVEKSEVTDCNFCDMPIFGMIGHFERVVHVIRWHCGLGYVEVGGGHSQNEGATVMCNDCTNQRLQIMVCPGHEFEPIPDASADYEALTNELLEAEPGGPDMQYQLSRWCSLCFSPAVFGCSTVQPDLCGEEETEIAGCHLRLCPVCEEVLRTQYDGNLHAMAAYLESQPKIAEADETLGRKIEGRPRADVGFLMEDSLLMRAAQADG